MNSDDGFEVTVGTSRPGEQKFLSLGRYDGGRGASDTRFYFNIGQAGVYFFRLLRLWVLIDEREEGLVPTSHRHWKVEGGGRSSSRDPLRSTLCEAIESGEASGIGSKHQWQAGIQG